MHNRKKPLTPTLSPQAGRGGYFGPRDRLSPVPVSVAIPAVGQKRSKLAPASCQGSSTIAGKTAAGVVDFPWRCSPSRIQHPGPNGSRRATPTPRFRRGIPLAYTAGRVAERIADIRLLGLGVVCGVAASAVLLAVALPRGELRIVIGVGAYVAGLLAMLGCSFLYRAATEPQRRQFFRRLDHTAIFAMIAGSATPFALARGGPRGLVVAAALWPVAGLGIAFKLRFSIGSVRRSALFYLVLGWVSLIAVGPAVSGETMMQIAAGGAFYSAGVLFLLWRRLPYRLTIWHGFVLAGAACHYLAILEGVVFA